MTMGTLLPLGKVHAGTKQVSDQITSKTYKLIDKETIFYRESVVYAFVNVTEKKGKYIISRRDFTDIINFVEHNNLVTL